MLSKITLENFKCFKGRNEFQLAPITLIYGPNSAGKSSILQALKLLRQTYAKAKRNTPLLFSCQNGLVNLGSFENVVHAHDAGLHIGMKLEFDMRSPTVIDFEDLGSSFDERHDVSVYDHMFRGDRSRIVPRPEDVREYSYEVRFINGAGDATVDRCAMSVTQLNTTTSKGVHILDKKTLNDVSTYTLRAESQGTRVMFLTEVEDRGAAYEYFLKHREAVLKGIERERKFEALLAATEERPWTEGEDLTARLSTPEYQAAYKRLGDKYDAIQTLFSRYFSKAEYDAVCRGIIKQSYARMNKFIPEYDQMPDRFGEDYENELGYLQSGGPGFQVHSGGPVKRSHLGVDD